MFFRPSALPLVDDWLQTLIANPTDRWDQGEFNRLAREGWIIDEPRGANAAKEPRRAPLSDPRLFRAYHGRVVGGVLPLALFCGGHNYFVAQMPQRQCVTRQGGSNSG